jgi:UDP-N-acetylmuramoyl-L-alanyl-D-glutamate--2,6-diaminopimelate ligase
MEVSSHALVQSRVDGIHFDVAVFTNLSHDHLDYHGTMEDYFEAKAALFTSNHALRAVVNADDPWGRLLLDRGKIPMTAVHHSDAGDVVLRPGHTEFTWRGHRVATPLTGGVNVDNALLAAEAALALDLELEPGEIAAAMTHLRPVPGRLQVIAAPASPDAEAASGGRAAEGGKRLSRPPFTVLVDYAHTPAGLEVVLAEARRLGPGPTGRVISVFGCGGNRDRAKRPVMGAVAATASDVAILTSDNPRNEDPLAIIEEVLAGIAGGRENPRVVVEADRRVAIRRALDAAEPGDVVVIAGKGHETYQEIAGRRLPFDDAVEVRDALSARFAAEPVTWVTPAHESPASTPADGSLSASVSRGTSAEG